MSKSAPAAPDYQGAAEAQAQSSREVTEQQTWANRPTINTPYGQQTWEVTPVWDPSTGQYLNTWTQNTNLTPESQSALDSQLRLQQGRSNLAEGLLGRVQEEYGEPMDWSQFQQMASTPTVPQYGQNLPAFSQMPQVPNYSTNQYSPEQIQRQLSTEGMQSVDPSQRYYGQAGDAIYNQWASRQEPRMQQESEAMRTQLYNMGLKEGDEAYNREMERLGQAQTDARQQAQYQATIGAGQEAQRMYGMDLGARQQQFDERMGGGQFANQAAQQALQQQLGIGGQRFQEQMGAGAQGFQQQMAAAQLGDTRRQQLGQEQLAFGGQQFNQQMQASNYQNQLRQQQIAEEMQRRGFSLNEINSILTGQQVSMPSMPSFNAANRSEGVQSLSAAQMQGQANLDAFNAEQQATQGLMSGIAGGAMMFSDRRLKKNVEVIGQRSDGLYAYKFNYIWEDPLHTRQHVGLMAQEVEKLYPEAIVRVHDYLMVDYGKLPEIP